jgi:hypothetical protein
MTDPKPITLEINIQAGKDLMLHKDQIRALETFFPRFAARIQNFGDNRDITVLNRLFEQGPDPLYLMETCPESFTRLCKNLRVEESVAREGIEKAHWQGPGALLVGTGVPFNAQFEGLIGTEHQVNGFLQECVWILMASASDCTEHGYDATMPERQKIAIAQKAAVKFYETSQWDRKQLLILIAAELKKMREAVTFEFDRNGRPHTTHDHGFYLGYKMGYIAVAVRSGPMTFWGSNGCDTLDGMGIKVDKKISEYFGIVFDKEGQ